MVITTSITAVSASTRKAQSKVSEPLSTHLRTGTTSASAPPAMKLKKIGQLSAQAMNRPAVVIDLLTTLPSVRLPNPAITAASKGRKTMASIGCTGPYPFIWLASSTAIVPRLRK